MARHQAWNHSGLAALVSMTILAASGCGTETSGPDGDALLDGSFGDATTCKEIPDLEPLVAPEIVVSIDGLTVHLFDNVTGYDRVFPVGVGSINGNAGETTYNESLSMFPPLYTDTADFTVTPADMTACKIWWTDSDTGQTVPVFAGLPFVRWWGNYGFHGPVTDYNEPDGGNLKRGYVSHGCFRMEAADILELYARLLGVAETPVHIQREPERGPSGRKVDVADRWIGSECVADADCSFEGGFCHDNELGGRGFCASRCERYCDDRFGYPTTLCVDDPAAAGEGMCVLREEGQNEGCRTQDHMQPREEERHGDPSTSAAACLPGSPGWIGDRCQGDDDCQLGTTCSADGDGDIGFCTQSCEAFCPDQPGFPWTFCLADAAGDNTCVRECTPSSNGAECPAGFACEARAGAAPGSPAKYACVAVSSY